MILGREIEQKKVGSLLDSARRGEGSTLVVIGDPGMGKTTLLSWAMSEAEGMTTLRSGGRESESDLPFVGLADLVRPLRDRIDTLNPPQARSLRSGLALSEPAAGDRLAMSTAVLHLLADAAADRPVLMMIDDYQWLDTATRNVIDFIARRSDVAGVGLILTTRDLGPAEHSGDEIRLEPLPEDLATTLVRETRPLSPEATRRVVSLAAGNPLALIELPRSLSSEDLLDTGTPIEPVEVSTRLQRAFRKDLERLSHSTRLAVLCVAEEGTGDLTAILPAVVAMGGARQEIDEAIASGLLVESEAGVEFRHPLVRSVAHMSGDPADIRRIHAAIAATVSDPDRRAWHLAAATSGHDQEAAEALEELANRAIARGAATPAAIALRKAAQLSLGDERRRLLIAAARAAHRAGNLDLTKSLIGQAKSDPGYQSDPTLLLLEADMRMRVGDFAEAYGSLRLEAARITEIDRPRATTMLLVAAKLRVYRHEGALALLEVEQALADVPEHERSVVHHSALAMAQTMAGHPDARETAQTAMREAVSSPHGHIHSLGIGWPLIWLEEYDMARAFLNRSAQIQRDGGFLAYLPLALLPLAELDYRTGHWNEARIHATEALRLLEDSNQPTDAAFAHLSLARLDAASGDTEAARHHAAFGRDGDLGQTAASIHADAALGFLELGLGNYSEAVRYLDQCVMAELRGGTREPWLLAHEADLAEALLRLGDRDRAASVAGALVERGEQMGRMSAVAAGHRALGLAANPEDFRAEFEIALEIHHGLPTPFELARTQLAYGERLRRSRHRVEARKSLRSALGIFEDLEATVWAQRAATELEVSGERLENPRSVTTLTRQERQVASLVARGATNREAATILFVNRKTIEFHLANVYRKLGVRSRTELANVMTGDRHQRDG